MVEQQYIDYWRNQQAKQDAQCEAWALEAWQVAREVALRLKQSFGVTEVIVFGSLAKGQFGEDSDIDLAIAGLKTADFFTALALANTNSRWWIDLKPMEALEPRFRDRVLSTGIAIELEQPHESM
ncbi:MAG: nucleotidyltransferase domain-containing protein [Cyanobacteria bacterium J06627_28]